MLKQELLHQHRCIDRLMKYSDIVQAKAIPHYHVLVLAKELENMNKDLEPVVDIDDKRKFAVEYQSFFKFVGNERVEERNFVITGNIFRE